MKTPRPLLLALLALAVTAPLAAETTSAPTSTPPAAYPLETCVVSGEALGSMGDAYVHVHKEEGKPDREVRLCCKGCLKKFNKEPAKYLKKLDEAANPAAAASASAAHAH